MKDKSIEFWEEEYKKIMDSPYYFYMNYCLMDGQKPTTLLKEEEFNKIFKEYETINK